jgi:hypothetical protein
MQFTTQKRENAEKNKRIKLFCNENLLNKTGNDMGGEEEGEGERSGL